MVKNSRAIADWGYRKEALMGPRATLRRLGEGVLASFALALISFLAPAATTNAATDPAVDRGRYLAAAGNCMSCHTREGGEQFAGGVAITTPFGTIYSTNITQDAETGIGKWTLEQFTSALRRGVGPDGRNLYPAFPYPSYTKLTDADISDLFSYLKTLSPVRYTPPENGLGFPFNQRWLLKAWNFLYLEEGEFKPDSSQSPEWNRGAYLVAGPGHCGACHTPRNFLGAEQSSRALHGATYEEAVGTKTQKWAASNLTSSPGGLAAWGAGDIFSYLKNGISERAGVFGPMNEVVVNSTRHLSEEDIRAIATYLKSLPASPEPSGSPPADAVMSRGSLQYDIHCGTCHLPTGLGSSDTAPPLVGSTVVLAADPSSLINVVLFSPTLPHTPPSEMWSARKWQRMEAFADKLDDENAAALLSFVRNSWGNRAGAVTAEEIAERRK